MKNRYQTNALRMLEKQLFNSFMQSYQGWRIWMQNTVLFLPKILKLVLFEIKTVVRLNKRNVEYLNVSLKNHTGLHKIAKRISYFVFFHFVKSQNPTNADQFKGFRCRHICTPPSISNIMHVLLSLSLMLSSLISLQYFHLSLYTTLVF